MHNRTHTSIYTSLHYRIFTHYIADHEYTHTHTHTHAHAHSQGVPRGRVDALLQPHHGERGCPRPLSAGGIYY